MLLTDRHRDREKEWRQWTHYHLLHGGNE